MKDFIVKIEFVGIAGKYVSHVEVRAKNAKSAEKKASKSIGNRDGWVVEIKEAVKYGK